MPKTWLKTRGGKRPSTSVSFKERQPSEPGFWPSRGIRQSATAGTTRRRRLRDAAALRHASVWHQQSQDDQFPERVALQRERGRLLDRAMQELPDTLGTPLRLWHTEHYSYLDIAKILGVSGGTIKSRMWDARQRLGVALHGL
jgi:DNA-directed RNA polymerase specialized sigma24 family protein